MEPWPTDRRLPTLEVSSHSTMIGILMQLQSASATCQQKYTINHFIFKQSTNLYLSYKNLFQARKPLGS